MEKINKITLAAIILGVGAGFAYWYFYSCDHGCAITSSWWKTSAFGGLFGYLLGDAVVDWKKREKQTS